MKFNPYWTVPKSIIEKDLVRDMHEDPHTPTKFRIRVFHGQGNEVAPRLSHGCRRQIPCATHSGKTLAAKTHWDAVR